MLGLYIFGHVLLGIVLSHAGVSLCRLLSGRRYRSRGSEVVGRKNGVRVHLTNTGAWS